MRTNQYRNDLVAPLVAAAAATYLGTDQVNEYARGLHVIVDITALGASATLTVTIEGKDPESGKYYTLLASTALNATGTTVLKVYPGLTASANVAANDILPRNWRVKAVGATQTVTATIAGSLIV